MARNEVTTAPPLLVPGDGTGRVPVTMVRVSLAGCRPTAGEISFGDCITALDSLQVLDLYVDEDDAAELTASATLIFHGEHVTGSGEVRGLGRFGVVDVGPLRFGETVEVAFGGGGPTDPIIEGFTVTDDPSVEYRIRVEVIECRVSNNSACGNGQDPTAFAYRGWDTAEPSVDSSQRSLEADQTAAPQAHPARRPHLTAPSPRSRSQALWPACRDLARCSSEKARAPSISKPASRPRRTS